MESKGKSSSEGIGATEVAELRDRSKSGTPLYIQVARTLKAEIVGGTYPIGTLLPTEDALCERFAVSRYTVREALRLLRGDGLVSSRQGAGTVVVPPRPADADIQQFMSINDLLAWASDSRLKVEAIRMVKVDDKLALRTGLPVGEEWLEVRGYRHGDGDSKPVCWAEYYVNRAYAAVGRLLQRHTGPIFPLLEDLFGLSITEVQQRISATLISPELAAVLGARPDSAALEVSRTYKTADGKIAQITINTHPGCRFQHSMTLRRVKS